MDDEIPKTAYLREFDNTKQCELMFMVNVNLENLGVLKEEIRAVRQISDSVESLLQHVVNKVKRSIKTLKEEENDVEVDVPVSLTSGLKQKPIQPKLVLKDLISNFNIKNIQFQIFNQKYFVVINAPLVKEIKLPVVIYCDFTVQASRLYILFAENNVCQYFWYKSKDKETWVKVANTSKYKPTEEDVDHYLKLVCIPCSSVLTGPPSEVISENRVERMGAIPTCPFEDRHKFTSKKLTQKSFRLVSYNVLSNRYADANDAFPYCPPRAKSMDYRKQLVSKELLGYQADIICLQEVDSILYTSYYNSIFKNKNYMSFYHRKGNRIPEGLACFFDKSRFKKEDDRQIIYSNEIKSKMFTYLYNFVKGNEDLQELFLRQMTSLQITVMKTKISRTNYFLIVGNTHLFYHPDAELVRLVQINMATTYLFKWKENLQNTGNAVVSVILCGDFNSIPTSAVYEYMTRGKIEKTHPIFKNTKHNIDLFHNFNFESACGTPRYTNYTDDFKDCLDYIFIEKDKIKVRNVIPFPSEKELSKYEGLPNDLYPSDHLALVVNLEIV